MSINITSGQIISGLRCQSFQVAGDIVIVWGVASECKVFEKENFNQKPKEYQIENQAIQKVCIPRQHELLILTTTEKEYIRDFNNHEIEEAKEWADYYFEPYTASFFRKDSRGIWYDIEGYRLDSSVFKIGHVICSLHGKTSRDSMAFKDEELIVSPGERIIQVGKLVLDVNLEVVLYFGEKVTGLGSKYISFGGEDVLQEVRLGLNKYGFVNEYTAEPFLIDNEEIEKHVATVEKGSHHYEIFESASRTYVVEDSSTDVFRYKEQAVTLDFDTYVKIGKNELLCAKLGEEAFYLDVKSKDAFTHPVVENEKVRFIDVVTCRIGSDFLYNLRTDKATLVFNVTQQTIFTLNEGSIQPESVEDAKGFETYYAFANYAGSKKLFYKKQNKVVHFVEEGVEVQTILSTGKSKLIKAKNLADEPIVLDARKGFDELQLAKIGTNNLIDIFGKPYSLSDTILQNVAIETLGGSTPRVVDLNAEPLRVFTLPKNLSAYPDQYEASGFQKNEICSIDYENPITKADHSFYPAVFISYFGNSHPVMLYTESGKPLQLDGAGHRNELVTGFNEQTFKKSYFLGEHQMAGAYTLTEDLKESEILFSLKDFDSWLPFFDSYLPIFKRIIEAENSEGWAYLLFELREISGEIEYAIVEKDAPYRIWTARQGGKPTPKLIKRKNKNLKSPETISTIRKILLLDNSFLAEV